MILRVAVRAPTFPDAAETVEVWLAALIEAAAVGGLFQSPPPARAVADILAFK
jgi:hypothetical protein